MRSGSHDNEHVDQIASYLGHTQTHKHTCTRIPPTWPTTTPILIHKHDNHSPRTWVEETFPWVIWKEWMLRSWFRVQFCHCQDCWEPSVSRFLQLEEPFHSSESIVLRSPLFIVSALQEHESMQHSQPPFLKSCVKRLKSCVNIRL